MGSASKALVASGEAGYARIAVIRYGRLGTETVEQGKGW